MAENDIEIGLGVNMGEFPSKMGEAEQKVKGLENATKSAKEHGEGFGSGLLKGVGSMIAFGGAAGIAEEGVHMLTEKLGEAFHAAEAEQVSNARLGTSLHNNVKGWHEGVDALDGFIGKQRALGFSNEAIKGSLSDLIAVTHNVGQAEKDQGIAEDLARARGLDLATATSLIAKVQAGHIGILGRYGIAVNKHATATEALAAIQAMAGGQAASYARTFEGSMDILKSAGENAMGKVGEVLLPKLTGAFSGFAGFISSDAFTGALSGATDLLSNGLGKAFEFVGHIIAMVAPVVGMIVQHFQKLFAVFGQAMSGDGAGLMKFFSDLGGPMGLVGNFLTNLIANFRAFFNTVTHGGDVVKALGTLIAGNLGAVFTFIGSLISWIATSGLPMLINALGNMGQALIDWIGPRIGPALAKLGEYAGALFGWITGTALPAIVSHLIMWGEAFITWIGPKIPPMLAEAGKLLLALGKWLIGTALPAIGSHLLEWGGAFIGWVGPMIPKVLLEIGKLEVALGKWLIGTALPSIVSHLLEWAGAFLGWIGTSVLPFIGAKLGEIATKIWGWITDTAKDALTKAAEMGKNIIDGIVNGLKAAGDAVKNFLLGLLKDGVDAVKNFFGIHSPSTLMHEMGLNLGMGLANGIRASAGVVGDAWGAVTGTVGAPRGGSASLSGSSAGGGYTVNIYLDGQLIEQQISSRMGASKRLAQAPV